jgi:FkbM family methyltransferase
MSIGLQYGSHELDFFGKKADIHFPLGTEENFGAIVSSRRSILEYETGLTNFIQANLTERDLFIDVGAQIGIFSILASTIGARCFSLEMRTSLVKAHFLTKSQNSFTGWTPLNFAIDEEVGLVPYDDNAQFALVGSNEKVRPVTGTVLSVPLDALTGAFPPAEKIFIKIDVEGFEVKAMRGMAKLLAEKRPILCVECHPHAAWVYGTHISAVGSLLPSDYRIFELLDHREGVGSNVREVSAIGSSGDNFVVFCIPKELDAKGLSHS